MVIRTSFKYMPKYTYVMYFIIKFKIMIQESLQIMFHWLMNGYSNKAAVTCEGLHDRTISLKGDVWTEDTSFTRH